MQLRDPKTLDVDNGSTVDELLDDLLGEEENAETGAVSTSEDKAAAPTIDPNALIAELQAMRQSIEEQFEKQAAPKEDKAEDEPAVKLDIPELKDEDLGKLADYKDKLEAIAKVATGEQMKAVADMVSDLRKQLSDMQKAMQQQAQATFAQQLRMQVPDLDKLHSDAKFAEYLAQPAPYSGGRTLRELLEEAYQAQNLMAAVEIIQGYKQRGEAKAQDVSARPQVHSLSGMPDAPKQDVPQDDLDQKYVEASNKLLDMYRRKELDDAQYQEAVMKLRRRYGVRDAALA